MKKRKINKKEMFGVVSYLNGKLAGWFPIQKVGAYLNQY